VSPTDVWAVGVSRTPSGEKARIEHWDGAGWTVSPVVAPGPSTHWNGRSWDRVPVPNPRSTWNQLAAITAHGPRDIWVVGWQQGEGSRSSLTEHWDGTTWSVVPANAGQELRAVMMGGGLVWATGTGTVRWDGSRWQQEA
jgi:hypothetical protein